MAAYRSEEHLTIGQLAKRTGLAVSAIRFYVDSGLISATRNSSGHRYFKRSDIRRVSFILIAQRLGFTLAEIGTYLAQLPEARTPTLNDWSELAEHFQEFINARILALEQLRDSLGSCIGCGCLSLEKCKLYNLDDKAANLGTGPRYLLGDAPS